jgi:hypothetical protein
LIQPDTINPTPQNLMSQVTLTDRQQSPFTSVLRAEGAEQVYVHPTILEDGSRAGWTVTHKRSGAAIWRTCTRREARIVRKAVESLLPWGTLDFEACQDAGREIGIAGIIREALSAR